jgi:hypothetical protein
VDGEEYRVRWLLLRGRSCWRKRCRNWEHPTPCIGAIRAGSGCFIREGIPFTALLRVPRRPRQPSEPRSQPPGLLARSCRSPQFMKAQGPGRVKTPLLDVAHCWSLLGEAQWGGGGRGAGALGHWGGGAPFGGASARVPRPAVPQCRGGSGSGVTRCADRQGKGREA